MDPEFVKWIGTLGVGGAIAALTLIFYNQLSKRHEDFIIRYTANVQEMNVQLIGMIKENTSSNTKLINLIENIERNVMRKQDIEDMINRRFRPMVKLEE